MTSKLGREPVFAGPSCKLRLAVGIATRGRPAILAETIAFLENQTRQPDQIVVAYAELADVGDAPGRFPQVTFLQTALGLTRQRNAILTLVAPCDAVLFIDDDFYPGPAYVEVTERAFLDHPEIVASTGTVVADDVKGPGLTVEEAKSIVANHVWHGEQEILPRYFAYGCNMCLRMAPVREHGLRFDEVLPLYGWYEDWDFSRQLAPFGSVVHISTPLGSISAPRLLACQECAWAMPRLPTRSTWRARVRSPGRTCSGSSPVPA